MGAHPISLTINEKDNEKGNNKGVAEALPQRPNKPAPSVKVKTHACTSPGWRLAPQTSPIPHHCRHPSATNRRRAPHWHHQLRRTAPVEHTASGLTLATVLLVVSGFFVAATLFFGTKGGYYDTDNYDGNGTAH